ncbi:MAG: UDP-N-acetylglucosamine 4,6-dehydratase (inverting), partial [Verrucomicrobia bacterium 21-51-4]
SGKLPTRFSVVRYGNVMGSRGSVIPLFMKQRESGVVTVTDPAMTRFFLTVDQGVKFVIDSLFTMIGGELFVPKLASCTIADLAEAIAPGCEQKIVGLRPGEKMHEILIPEDEARLTLEFPRYYIIKPTLPFWANTAAELNGKRVNKQFSYASNTNPQQMGVEDLRNLCAPFLEQAPEAQQQLCPA